MPWPGGGASLHAMRRRRVLLASAGVMAQALRLKMAADVADWVEELARPRGGGWLATAG
jgi:hypothetical protein